MMDTLPIELLDIIASQGSDVYFGLLGCKFFTDTLNPGKIVDFMILFGHSVKITKDEIEWTKHGELHRVDGPAIESNWSYYGSKEWYQYGLRHRDNDLPAVVRTCKKKWYCRYAIQGEEYITNRKWYRHGRLHRDNDEPAVDDTDGTKEWYQHGELHRDNDLPAIRAYVTGSSPPYTPVLFTEQWYQHGKNHRDGDKPAFSSITGDKRWYQNGELHRDGNLPASVYPNGNKEYYQHGKLIRTEKAQW